MSTFKDFTDFDNDDQPIEVGWRGRKWEIPRPSALQQARVDAAYLAQADLEFRNPDDDLSDDEVAELREALKAADYLTQMKQLCGEEMVEDMLASGMGGETFKAIFRHVFGLDSGEASPGEASAPRGAPQQAAQEKARRTQAARSSNGGPRSRRTSTANTASPT